MIQDYQLTSKQLLQMDTMTCHHPLIQGPQKGHGCLESQCHFLPLHHKPRDRGITETCFFFLKKKKRVLPCILQDNLAKRGGSSAQLGTSENPIWEERWPVAEAAGLFFAQGYHTKRSEFVNSTSRTATRFHVHFEPSHHIIDVSLIAFLFFKRNSILIGLINTGFCDYEYFKPL